MKTRITIIVTALLLYTGCSHKNIEIVEDGDSLLSCTKLTKEISDLIDTNDDINDNTGFSITSVSTWVLWPPLGLSNQAAASFSRDDVDKRFYHLMKLKKSKNCKFTNKEKLFINNKGRFSDLLN